MGNTFTDFDFPPVLGADGNPITVEQSEKALQAKPSYIPFVVEYNGQPTTFSVACNLDNVDDATMSEYELFKNERTAIFRQKPAKVVNGKAVASDDDGPTGEQLIKSAKMRPRERQIFLKLLFPHDWQENPVILGSNYPNMPKEAAERKAWFERGGVAQSVIIEEVVMRIDPTGPLADAREKEALNKKLYQSMEETMQQKLREIQELDVTKALAPVNAVEETLETESQPSLQTESTSEQTQDLEIQSETESSQTSEEQ